ncbi:major capsid protein VP54 [Paramecium bursaria Chlorella virus NE-JV-1]|nr:major capsid protein VP54 [Paramecium bursaria Chlorella virus NE-JV-1]
MNDNGSDMILHGEEWISYAKPEWESLKPNEKRFENTTLTPHEMTFDNVYPLVAGKFDIKPVKDDKVPLEKQVTGTASEGTFVQLLSRGPQDFFLSYNPQMTFFKQVYRRYTNFAIEASEEKFSTTVRFGTKNICQLSKNGDLVGHMSFRIKLPNLGIPGGRWVQTIGYNVLGLVRLRIGDIVVQAHEGIYLDVDDKLFCPSEKYEGISKLVKRDEILTTDQEHDIIVPLKFFNCYRPSTKQQFLPILNLAPNIEVFLEFVLKPLSSLVIVPTGTSIPDVPNIDAGVIVDYVFLDDAEKYRFAQRPTRLLIEQIPVLDTPNYLTSTGGATIQQDKVYIQTRELNKPCSFFAVVALGANDFTSFEYIDMIKSGTFYLNSDKQFEERSGEYWKLVQPYQHFTRSVPTNNIYTFSFALDTASFQPNGFLNFAPYVRTFLAFDIVKQDVPTRTKTFAVCLNWLEFSDGTARLLFN